MKTNLVETFRAIHHGEVVISLLRSAADFLQSNSNRVRVVREFRWLDWHWA